MNNPYRGNKIVIFPLAELLIVALKASLDWKMNGKTEDQKAFESLIIEVISDSCIGYGGCATSYSTQSIEVVEGAPALIGKYTECERCYQSYPQVLENREILRQFY